MALYDPNNRPSRGGSGAPRGRGRAPESLLTGGGIGPGLAALALLGLIGGGVAFAVYARDDGEATAADSDDAQPPDREAAQVADAPDDDDDGDETDGEPAPRTHPLATSLARVTWTTDTASTLEDLAKTWTIPSDRLVSLNPELAKQGEVPAGTKVVVHTEAIASGQAIGPPNDGRLTGGVPLPEGDAWLMPEDRTRAFGTEETVAAIVAALDTYARQYPGADPIQIGDISERRGGKIYGHQSHQIGIDVDIRLVRDATGEGFDAERNWFLVKTLMDNNEIKAIFLNAREQAWLREAAKADVGQGRLDDYFAFINHEKGHTIHMHVRFACADSHKRCVGLSQPDTGEDAPKLRKLPGFSGKPPRKGASKPTVLRPKGGAKPRAGKLPGR